MYHKQGRWCASVAERDDTKFKEVNDWEFAKGNQLSMWNLYDQEGLTITMNWMSIPMIYLKDVVCLVQLLWGLRFMPTITCLASTVLPKWQSLPITTEVSKSSLFPKVRNIVIEKRLFETILTKSINNCGISFGLGFHFRSPCRKNVRFWLLRK